MELSPFHLPSPWRGAVRWTRFEGYWLPWRLPPDTLASAHSAELVARARMPAGVRASFVTQARKLILRYRCDDEDGGPVDVLVDRELVRRHATSAGLNELDLEMMPGQKEVDLWLPQFGEIAVSMLAVDDEKMKPSSVQQPTWITYGSSITQCRTARGPSATWPAQIAMEYGWDLTCLGFGAQCHLDPVVARTIAALRADVISLCLGVNVYAAASFGGRSWPSQVTGFLQTIRDGHPDAPIMVITPIACPKYDGIPNAVGLTLEDVRRGVVRACEVLQDLGDRNLWVTDGRELFGRDDCDLLGDGLHPTAEGYDLIAQRLGPRLASLAKAPHLQASIRPAGGESVP